MFHGLNAESRRWTSTTARGKERLVILGSGWGGYEVLRRIDKKRWDVTVISPNGYFNFTPLLAGCAVGTLELRCAVEPVRKYAPQIRTYQAWCDDIDFKKKTIKCVSPERSIPYSGSPPISSSIASSSSSKDHSTSNPSFNLDYDKLVIAVGAYSQTFNVPGVKEHGMFLRDVRDARAIRSRIIECFEQASQPHLSDVEKRKLLNFCIVGGGPTGVEFSAELYDLIHSDIETHYPDVVKHARINLYDVSPKILGTFDKNLVAYTEKTLTREGVRIRTSHHVERVEANKMYVREQGEVPFGLLVWSTGLAPNPLIETMTGLKKIAKRCIATTSHLNAIQENGEPLEDVWVIGDAGMIPEQVLPATAQVANQKAKYLTKKLNRIIRDRPSPAPFEFYNQGSLAYIGDWRAVYDKPQTENSSIETKQAGRLAWLLWRSAYFTMTLSARIFGRDLTKF
ncbi:FAD/NAD(P)-binding domain-containing protein [Fistulina hepatica ATCC 64428]|uniref:FAD/NAD(P)-binding domain-containing protein n=1 Tax=Fistulina hepatica ATCC 64428 TaxID=1128425 RepID=A0A0D7AED9_9AGAR|nr:FAD/NAD(P)-binding domain-containing protein [Fistulina hepatica ATCC 64428]